MKGDGSHDVRLGKQRTVPLFPSLDPVVVGLLLLALIWWQVVLALRYWAFDYWDWDLSIFSQMMWNLSHGQPYSSIMQVHILGNHANVLAYVFAPLYALLPHPYTLLTLKILCCLGAAVPFCSLARRHCGPWLTRALVVAFVLYPPLTYALYYDFDWESLSPLLVMGLWWAYASNRRGWFALIAIPTLLLKENLPLIVAAFGLVGLFRKPRKPFWAGVVVASLAWFALAVFFIVPAARGAATSAYWSHYAHLGDSPFAIMQTIVWHPIATARLLLTSERLWWFWQLFAPVGLLALVGLDQVAFGLPIFLQHFLSSAGTEHTIQFSYGALPTPFIFMGALYGVTRVLRIGRHIRWLPLALGATLVGSAIWTQLAWGTIPPLIQGFRAQLLRDDLDDQRAQLLRRIPPRAPVLATFETLPNLSNRATLHALHNVYFNRQRMADSMTPYALPEDLRYALLDVNDRQLVNWVTDVPQMSHNLFRFYTGHPWHVEAVADSLILLRRDPERSERTASRALFAVSELPLGAEASASWRFQGGLRLVRPASELVGRGAPGSVIPLRITWQKTEETDASAAALIAWVDGNGRTVRTTLHPIGYRFFPTWMWKPGIQVQEELGLLVPRALTSGSYRLILQLHNEKTRVVVELEPRQERAVGPGAVLYGSVVVTAGRPRAHRARHSAAALMAAASE